MTRIGLQVSLDTGALVSSAAMAKDAIKQLDDEIAKANKNGDKAKLGELSYAKDRILSAQAGFERDAKSLMNNPLYQQTMTKQMNGQELDKREEQFASGLHTLTDSIRKTITEIAELSSEDIVRRAAELSARTADFHKLVSEKSAPPQGTGYAAAIAEAEQEGRWQDWASLSLDRDRFNTQNHTFNQDMQGLALDPRYQKDPEFASSVKDLIAAIKKLTADYEAAEKAGDFSQAQDIVSQLETQQTDFHKLVSEKNAPPATQKALQAISAGQIVSAVTSGFQQWVGSLDRSGIVNQYGSGDVLGGRISEERRQADFAGGIAQSAGGILGAVVGSLVPGVGTMLGGALGTGLGSLINSALHIKPNEDATDAAYAGLWQNRSGEAMQLAALMGEVNNVRGSFKTAADAAAAFGYSAEEGMDAMKQAAQQGLSGEEARSLTGRVFDYERRTGADRGTLMGISTMAARYGAGDALGMGWAGLQASGMKPGQYNEYLRAMQRVMEDGIGKGFVRSAKEIAGDLTLVNQMAGGSELWKGERGQQRLAQMNAGLESATGLSSATDILAFRGAQQVLEGMNESDWKRYSDLDRDGKGDIKRSGDYIDAMVVLEKGLTADLFQKQMELINNAEGGGRTGSIERIRQMYGLNYTNSAMLYDTWQSREASGNPLDNKEIEALLKTFGKMPPNASSPELEVARMIQEIKNLMAETGQSYWDAQITKITDALQAAKEENDAAKQPAYQLPDTSRLSPADALKFWRKEYEYAEKSGDAARIAAVDKRLAEAERAAAATPDPMPGTSQRNNLTWEANKAVEGFFDNRGQDAAAMDTIEGTLRRDIASGDPQKLKQAEEFVRLLKSNEKNRATWNANNTLNPLANSNDIGAMLPLLKAILEATKENGQASVIVEVP